MQLLSQVIMISVLLGIMGGVILLILSLPFAPYTDYLDEPIESNEEVIKKHLRLSDSHTSTINQHASIIDNHSKLLEEQANNLNLVINQLKELKQDKVGAGKYIKCPYCLEEKFEGSIECEHCKEKII